MCRFSVLQVFGPSSRGNDSFLTVLASRSPNSLASSSSITNLFSFHTFYPVAHFPRNLARAPGPLSCHRSDKFHPKSARWLQSGLTGRSGPKEVLPPVLLLTEVLSPTALISSRAAFCSPCPPPRQDWLCREQRGDPAEPRAGLNPGAGGGWAVRPCRAQHLKPQRFSAVKTSSRSPSRRESTEVLQVHQQVRGKPTRGTGDPPAGLCGAPAESQQTSHYRDTYRSLKTIMRMRPTAGAA